MSIRAILFDKDGTLIDFADTFFNACSNIIYHLSNDDKNLAIELATVADFDLQTNTCVATSEIIGGTSLTIAGLWQPLLKRGSVEELSLELDDYFDKYTQISVTDFEFTKPTLKKLAQMGIVLGVGTNDSENNARSHLGQIGIEGMFSFIAGYDSGHGSKPDPGMIEEFARRQGIETWEIIMVGDSLNDLLAGRNAGSKIVAVTSGLAVKTQLEPYADHIIEDISRLPDLISTGL